MSDNVIAGKFGKRKPSRQDLHYSVEVMQMDDETICTVSVYLDGKVQKDVPQFIRRTVVADLVGVISMMLMDDAAGVEQL